MNTIGWLGLTILFVFFAAISLLSYAVILLYLKVKSRKGKKCFCLKKMWFQIWLVITESAGLFLFLKPFIALLSWVVVMFLTLIICKRQNERVEIVDVCKDKKSLSRRMEEEEREAQQKSEFRRYCNRSLYKAVYFSFGLFFIARVVALIPVLDIGIQYAVIAGYFYDLFQILSVSSLLMFVIYLLQLVGPYWHSRFHWSVDRGYRLIVCIGYYSIILFIIIAFTLFYFGIVE